MHFLKNHWIEKLQCAVSRGFPCNSWRLHAFLGWATIRMSSLLKSQSFISTLTHKHDGSPGKKILIYLFPYPHSHTFVFSRLSVPLCHTLHQSSVSSMLLHQPDQHALLSGEQLPDKPLHWQWCTGGTEEWSVYNSTLISEKFVS